MDRGNCVKKELDGLKDNVYVKTTSDLRAKQRQTENSNCFSSI